MRLRPNLVLLVVCWMTLAACSASDTGGAGGAGANPAGAGGSTGGHASGADGGQNSAGGSSAGGGSGARGGDLGTTGGGGAVSGAAGMNPVAGGASGGSDAHNSGGSSQGGSSQGGSSQGGSSQGGSSQGGSSQGGSSQGGSSQGGASGVLGPRFIGRFDLSTPSAPAFAWSGTAISLRFEGTAIGVTLTDGGSNVFEVILDGKHTVVPSVSGTKKYQLGTGLSDGPHDLLLYRRTEASFGPTVFGGFDIDPSAYLAAAAPPSRRLEVIGDSISAGYGDEGTYPCTASDSNENHYLTYEALAARSVGAELYTEAWSGIGMLINYDGSRTNTMPVLYPRTLPQTQSSTWAFAGFIPDAVVINLGTNDFAIQDPGAAFQTTYTTFVTDLRSHYPKARFFLAVGPMLGGDSYTKAKSYLAGVVADRASAGDNNLTVLEFGTQDASDGLGCDYHPSLATHQKVADKLVAALKADLGW